MHVFAGMPSLQLTDVAKLRLENISFFAAGFLLSAWFIQLLWNYLQRDWTFLPRLSYGKALGAATLWSVLFILVLTMISGARELMTPGAWEKKGLTHKLAEDATDLPLLRRQQLEKLRDALWTYADQNQGAFPPDKTESRFSPSLWELPDPSGVQYVYVAGKRSNDAVPVAYEPEMYGNDRYVLLANGEIRRLEFERLQQMLPAEKR